MLKWSIHHHDQSWFKAGIAAGDCLAKCLGPGSTIQHGKIKSLLDAQADAG